METGTASEPISKRPQWYPKGVSGNPAGRPTLTAEEKVKRKEIRKAVRANELRALDIIEMAREHATIAVKTLAQIAVKSESDDARIKAATVLLDRGFGKAVEQVMNINVDVHTPEREAQQQQALANLNALIGRTSDALKAGATLPRLRVVEHDADA